MGFVSPNILIRAGTLVRLGIGNVLRVANYRLASKLGAYKRRLPVGAVLRGPFFDWSAVSDAEIRPSGVDAARWIEDGERILRGELEVFSHRRVNAGFPPVWHRSVLSQIELAEPLRHWSDIGHFSPAAGDIKGYWELGRFDAFLTLALGWIVGRRATFCDALERWLQHFAEHNPVNRGIHWACGQETSLRLLQIILAATLLRRWGGVRPTAALCELVAQHCARIPPTLMYAVGQDNNHGTSEAAALFVGGAFLERHGAAVQRTQGAAWCRAGRQRLAERVLRLVMPDGSFAQHSTNYHRLMLDTCSIAEYFRRELAQPEFPPELIGRCRAATAWLEAFTDPGNGGVPNLGANDGARMFVLHHAGYGDCRPSVHLAAALFENRAAYAGGDEILRWLAIDRPAAPRPAVRVSRLWKDGGYVALARADTWLMLRLPTYRFRPSQSDALHLDLWHRGVNVLRDGGSFSYNTTDELLAYFGGVASHNTVQLDGRDQMPRLSRFLFGDWLRAEDFEYLPASGKVSARYTDYLGGTHRRTVLLDERGRCTVNDEVAGFARSAMLRWRTPAGSEWILDGDTWRSGALRVRVTASAPMRTELLDGWEAPFYGAKKALPVIFAEVTTAASFTTEIFWEP